jgi:hypothetical protein
MFEMIYLLIGTYVAGKIHKDEIIRFRDDCVGNGYDWVDTFLLVVMIVITVINWPFALVFHKALK